MVVGGGRRMAHKLQPSHEKNAATRKVDGSMTRTWHDAEPDKTTEAKLHHTINEKRVAGYAELTHSAGRSWTELRDHCTVVSGLPERNHYQIASPRSPSSTRQKLHTDFITNCSARSFLSCVANCLKGPVWFLLPFGWPEGNTNGRQRGQKRTRQQIPLGAQGRTFGKHRWGVVPNSQGLG